MPPAVKTTAVLSSWPLEGGNSLCPRQELRLFQKSGRGREREMFMRLIELTLMCKHGGEILTSTEFSLINLHALLIIFATFKGHHHYSMILLNDLPHQHFV